MVQALQLASLALALAATAFVLVLVLRRMVLSREERQRHDVEERLRDDALALVDGDHVALPELRRGEAEIFARMLARYSRQLSGEPREHIARYFEDGGHVSHQIGLLEARRSWKRAAAAATLGDMASPAAIPPLIDSLEDPERDVRAAATRSLALLGASVAGAPIVETLAPRVAGGARPLLGGGADRREARRRARAAGGRRLGPDADRRPCLDPPARSP